METTDLPYQEPFCPPLKTVSTKEKTWFHWKTLEDMVPLDGKLEQ